MFRITWPLHIVKRVAALVVALAVLGVAVPLTYQWVQERQSRCADGVVKKDVRSRPGEQECVGISDGSHVFAPHLREVSRRIEAENDRVAEKGAPYVSVAYMTTFTLTDKDSNSEESVRHELEGAYLAQRRHNAGDLRGSPRIRLLIVNPGSESAHWWDVVDQLAERRDAPDRLVAVTGLGPSTKENKAALRALSRHRIAMVAGTMTATDFHSIDGFVRVAPPNTDEARAAAAFLRREKYRTAVVVQDIAPTNRYANTLGPAFEEAFGDEGGEHRIVADEELTFDSSASTGWENELRHMTGQLCQQKPQVVFFAGRGRHLTHFLDALANRTCTREDFLVVTGDDTSNLTSRELERAYDTGVEVLYTGLAHPDMWQGSAAGKRAVSAATAAKFRDGGELDRWFPHDTRDDGQAIMAHDAVLTAARGAGMAAQWGGEVTGESVGRMFHKMNLEQRVPGGSGFLSFRNNGDPRNKAVPILRLTENKRAEFIEVSAPSGAPPGDGQKERDSPEAR
ncbi:branched-chain amino acid ABC transporter substrate-binding protein [Streptomyces diacarni]|uniref:Branched-chain amino acid ABC transporter substrate-binding protein n=1 Tax=Streptomyces diacarni TaxID=2800381 RepID=A0A367F7R4_9ACTN|nr:ABC transporter substrate-binding protein [Streptomyces diacarni]RCG25590.1 branched-chain amino acid ABC transporter substrate-binding protein [Streptomyces diacarni]